MRRIINICFIGVFGALMIFPFLLADKAGGGISEEENRYLARAPELKWHEGFNTEVENWINDNVGGKSILRQIYNYININILKSCRDSQFYYHDDWVYLISNPVPLMLQHGDNMSEIELNDFIAKYESIQTYFEQRDIRFCTTIFPHKVDVYPENLPFIRQKFPVSQLEIMQENMAANKKYHMSVLYDKLIQTKEKGELVYSKAYDGSHWNNKGAFIGYKGLMEQLQEVCPEIPVYDETDFNFTLVKRTKEYNGREYEEEDIEYSFKKEQKANLDMSWFEKQKFVSKDIWKSYKYYLNEDSTLPKAIIVGDSYVWMFLLPYIAESFSELLFIHDLDSDQLLTLAERIEPNVIAFAGLNNSIRNSVFSVSNSVDRYNHLYKLKGNKTAQIVKDTTPDKIERHKNYAVEIVVKNTSSIAWTKNENIGLCIWRDNKDLGYRVMLEEGMIVEPGMEHTFMIQIREDAADECLLEYQMLSEGYCYFGERKSVNIKVLPPK